MHEFNRPNYELNWVEKMWLLDSWACASKRTNIHMYIILNLLDIFIYISFFLYCWCTKQQQRQQQQYCLLLIEPMIMAFDAKKNILCTLHIPIKIISLLLQFMHHTQCMHRSVWTQAYAWASTTTDKYYIDPTTKYEWRYQIAVCCIAFRNEFN